MVNESRFGDEAGFFLLFCELRIFLLHGGSQEETRGGNNYWLMINRCDTVLNWRGPKKNVRTTHRLPEANLVC